MNNAEIEQPKDAKQNFSDAIGGENSCNLANDNRISAEEHNTPAAPPQERTKKRTCPTALFSADDLTWVLQTSGIQQAVWSAHPLSEGGSFQLIRFRSFLNRESARLIASCWIASHDRKACASQRRRIKFVKEFERRTRALIALVGDADEEHLRSVREYESYFSEDDFHIKTKNFESHGYIDFCLEDLFFSLVGANNALKLDISESEFSRPRGAPSIGPLGDFVLGLAIEYQGLTLERFTFKRYPDGKGNYLPVTHGHRFVATIIEHLAPSLAKPIESSAICTAAERAVATLRRLDHAAGPKKSARVSNVSSDRKQLRMARHIAKQ